MHNPTPTLLVVDDEQAVASVLCRGLSRAGYDVSVACNGEEALARLETEPFDVLLSDIHMPKMRGDELQRRARERAPDLAVVLITAAYDVSVAVECLREGVFDYVTKPFDLSDVIARVNKALERRDLLRAKRGYQADLEKRVAEQAERLHQTMRGSLEALIHALEAKDPNTRDHSARVSHLAVRLVRHLCSGEAALAERVRVAALFHDVGKIGVPEAILNKPGRLTEGEMAFVRRHPEIGETILAPLLEPEMLAIVRHHHERWDGNGYLDGLSGAFIPLGARIVAVADSFDAMTSSRPYRDRLSPADAGAVFQENAGRQWDPRIVAAILPLIESGEIAAEGEAAARKKAA